jgi:hypothetical protein
MLLSVVYKVYTPLYFFQKWKKRLRKKRLDALAKEAGFWGLFLRP